MKFTRTHNLLILFVSIFVFINFCPIFAQTEVSGNIITDTTWTKDNSPYIVTEGLIVDVGATLTIEPGVVVKLDHSGISIFGELIARGTKTDSIYFIQYIEGIYGWWRSIRFVDESVDATYDDEDNYISGSIIEYARIEGAHYVGINLTNASPLISRNTISNNSGTSFYSAKGGGIHCFNSHPKICENTISYNSGFEGGGIYIWNVVGYVGSVYYDGDSPPRIIKNNISNNFVNGASGDGCGGGICCYGSSPIISENTISNNIANVGGGIYCNNWSSPIISKNIISGNKAEVRFYDQRGCGGGIYCNNWSSPIISENIITGNKMGYYGDGNYSGGIYCINYSSPEINHNNIFNNEGFDIYTENNKDNKDIDAKNNWWGTTNKDSISAHIYDYWDYIELGKVNYEPFLTEQINIDEITSIKLISKNVPDLYRLFQNYPNPFNPETNIKYKIPKTSNVEIVIYNTLGQKIKTLLNEIQNPGVYEIMWDGKNKYGIPVTSGIYFYELKTEDFIEVKKMLLIK